MKKNFSIKAPLLVLFLLVAVSVVRGQGILFSQYRIILNQNAVTSMYVTNPAKTPITYAIGFIDRRMDKNGSVSIVPPNESFQYSIKPYLRAFPRSILLKPGQSQEVQIQLKTPAMLAEGEYHSFITFTPRQANSGSQATGQDGVKMNIKFKIASAIPIIFRKNAKIDQISIDSVQLSKTKDGTTLLHLTIDRKGTRSVYGKIVLADASTLNETPVGTPAQAVIYTEINRLHLAIPIDIAKINHQNGTIKLHISYIDTENPNNSNLIKLADTYAELTVIE